MARLGPALFAGRHLGRSGRLRFGGALRRRRLEAVFEVAELGLEFEQTRFEPRNLNPATRALGKRFGERGVHPKRLPKSKGKRKIKRDRMNGYVVLKDDKFVDVAKIS